MTRRYSDPVHVWTRAQRPDGFRWQGREYTVRAVVDHWISLPRDWYPSAQATLPRREHWRVRAACGHGHGTYELRLEPDTEQWFLERVWD